MARIKYSALIDDIRGSIGGTTFQGNQYGYTVRRKPNMTRPNKALQERQKVPLALATRAWRQLTGTQQTAWNTFATNNPQGTRNDPNVPMSGFAVFTRLNVLRLLSGLALYTSSPNITVPSSDYQLGPPSVDGAARNFNLSTPSPLDGTFTGMFYMSPPIGDGVNVLRNKLRLVGTASITSATVDVATGYQNVFGSTFSDSDRIGCFMLAFVPDNGWVVRTSRDILVVLTD